MTRKSSSTVTMRHVADKVGVSVATVSRYINRSAPVSQHVAERIEQAMAELKYVPHAAARQLATNKTRLLGLLLTNMYADFFGPLLHGIESVVSQNGYNLLVASCRSQSDSILPLPLGPHNTDGMLVFAGSLGEERLAELCSQDFPVVLIHHTAPSSLPVPCVTVENEAAVYKLVGHLIEAHGRSRIVFMKGPEDSEDAYRRELGYRSALQDHGIQVDPEWMLEGQFRRDIAYRSLKDFIEARQGVDFDAVFSGNDDAAIGVMEALKEAGCRIPEDVSVAGFDDSRLSAFLDPPLTTARPPTTDVGRIAAQNLFGLIQGIPVKQVTLLPTEIVLRRSCGCPPIGKGFRLA